MFYSGQKCDAVRTILRRTETRFSAVDIIHVVAIISIALPSVGPAPTTHPSQIRSHKNTFAYSVRDYYDL